MSNYNSCFNDFSKILCDLITKGSYINYSDKEPEELKLKDQNFDKTVNKTRLTLVLLQ
jgi:hypothetical protein